MVVTGASTVMVDPKMPQHEHALEYAATLEQADAYTGIAL